MNTREHDCEDLNLAIDDLRREGFRLDVIYPADDPKCAVLSRAGESVRLALPGARAPAEGLPEFVPQFVLKRSGTARSDGRAGMLYRDLIPSRLGGRYIASHISIPEGGPVDDWVHYHRIALQMIIVKSGWVRLVYEDQGAPFVMEAGDMVLQPPLIRHRVLESSSGLEVVEIGAPALHETFADHEMGLPNGRSPERLFGRQRFLHHRASNALWTPFDQGEVQETAMKEASDGLADVRLFRPAGSTSMEFGPHEGELVFGFVLEGWTGLRGELLGPNDAFVVPPLEGWSLTDMSDDFRLLLVTTARLDASAGCLL